MSNLLIFENFLYKTSCTVVLPLPIKNFFNMFDERDGLKGFEPSLKSSLKLPFVWVNLLEEFFGGKTGH